MIGEHIVAAVSSLDHDQTSSLADLSEVERITAPAAIPRSQDGIDPPNMRYDNPSYTNESSIDSLRDFAADRILAGEGA